MIVTALTTIAMMTKMMMMMMRERERERERAVSYTHLTLPTMAVV